MVCSSFSDLHDKRAQDKGHVGQVSKFRGRNGSEKEEEGVKRVKLVFYSTSRLID
jgi:hypothetical protein